MNATKRIAAVIFAIATCTIAGGCALALPSIGANLLSTITEPAGSVQPCPDCPNGMTADEYIRQQRTMQKKAQESMGQYTEVPSR